MLRAGKPVSSQPLKEALLEKQEDGLSQPQRKAPFLGLVLVTGAALLFGVVAACVKAIDMPTLVLQLCRSVIEWGLGVGAALWYSRRAAAQVVPVEIDGCEPSSEPPTSLHLLLLGPPQLRGWLVLRGLLYWLFLACWWFALASMPIGDATTIVYVGPIFTATFAYLFLGERIDWSFYPIVLLDAIGLLLITQPTFIFGGGRTMDAAAERSYYIGALSSLISAVVAGLLPICTRKSKACFWTAVNHCSSALSALVFTPIAMAVWFWLDPVAPQLTAHSLGELTGVPQLLALVSGSGAPAGIDSAELLTKWALLLGATLTGFLGLAMQTLGYQLEEAARASVMTVLEIPFAYVLQYYLFGEPITPLGLVGVGLVICATMLNLLRRLQMS